jgi:hypothetical protein
MYVLIFAASLATAGWGVKTDNTTLMVIGGVVALITAQLLRVLWRRRAQVMRDRKHFGHN